MEKTVAEIFGLKEPKPYKGKQNPDKTSNDDLMVGMELEIENVGNGQEWYSERAGAFWKVEEDGSLRPRGAAWEFISKPATLGTTLAELRIFFERFGFTEANYSDRCSVHIHTNVCNFTQQQVANLALVYPVVEPILFRYVNHHKKLEDQGYCRDTNLYCIPWWDCRMNRNFIEKFFDDPIGVGGRDTLGRVRRGSSVTWEKYTALNFAPISTIGTCEWRHMHGTSDMEKLTTWLNVIGAIMRFCKENDFADIVKTIKILNDVSTYQQFFNAVLGGTLEYKEEFRRPMAEGVVNAKYSLVNWEANKGKEKPVPSKKSYAGYQFAEPGAFHQEYLVDGEVVQAEVVQAAMEGLEEPGQAPRDPWPARMEAQADVRPWRQLAEEREAARDIVERGRQQQRMLDINRMQMEELQRDNALPHPAQNHIRPFDLAGVAREGGAPFPRVNTIPPARDRFGTRNPRR